MDETWDVPDDHFTENVLSDHLRYRAKLTEDESFFVRCKGKFHIDVYDEKNFPIPSGDHGGFGFQGWNPICVPTIYYINWKIEQIKIWRDKCQFPDFEEFQKRKTSSQLRREAGENRRKAGIKEKYGATKCYIEKKQVWWLNYE